MSDTVEESISPGANWKISLAIAGAVLAVSLGVAAVTFLTEPEAQRSSVAKSTAMLVDVVSVERSTFTPEIVATATVQAEQDIELRPQVSGRVVEVASEFTPGGFVAEGDLLVKLEAADFRYALAQTRSNLRDALSALAVEEGRQDAARAEYAFLDETLEPENEELVLRTPQLEAARERVKAARAAVSQAELNLRRTQIRAPFDAHIIDRRANVGSQVSPGEALGRLVGVDAYWVRIDVPVSKLPWVRVGGAEKGAEVRVRNARGWPEGVYRQGFVSRLVGTLDGQTRMARLLGIVEDPMGRESGGPDKPPLMIGEFLQATIVGEPLEDVVKLNRDYLRSDDTVWVMVDGKLEVRSADVVMRDATHAYITEGLEGGEEVVTTNLSTVVDGARLRLDPEQESDESEESENE